jgi:hypothetical protein
MGRTGTKLRLAGLLALSLAAAAQAQTGTAPTPGVCAKAAFEAVVDEAAAALRDLNFKNKPAFQEKLRRLKDKRGWSHDEFLKEGTAFVRDDKIAVFDQDSERLLSDISSQGQEGAEAKTPDCALMTDLRGRMKVLVETQTAKWAYVREARRGAGVSGAMPDIALALTSL